MKALILFAIFSAASAHLTTVGTVGGKTYKIQTKTNFTTWVDAKAFCEQNKLNLATVETKAQNQLIGNYIKKLAESGSEGYKVYLGGTNDKGTPADWYWVGNGQPIKYNNFEGGRIPSTTGENDKCIYMTPSRVWVNSYCTLGLARAICS